MVMYITKTWGFDSSRWPLVTFSRPGVREKLRAAWRPRDTMLIVATLGEQVDGAERGRVLGYQEFTNVGATTREVVEPSMLEEMGDRWPFGLTIRRSWRIVDPPLFKDLLPEAARKYGGRFLAANFGELTIEEEARVRALPAREEDVPQTETIRRASAQVNLRASLTSQRGPIPSLTSYEVERVAQPAVTYLLERQPSAALMKVGWSYNPQERAKGLSEALVPALTNERWIVLQEKAWQTEAAAYEMEQALLDILDRHKVARVGEYFRTPPRKSLVTTSWWFDAMVRAQAVQDGALG